MTGLNMNFMQQTQSRNNFPNDSNCYEAFQNPEPPAQSLHSMAAQNVSNSQTGGYQMPPPNFLIPDLSRPPPGFNMPGGGNVVPMQNAQPLPSIDQTAIVAPVVVMPPQEEVKPNAPYYELPAGLIVPLIPIEDYNYRPLDPDNIRLPPAAPPSERLIGAIEAFYSLPSHERPRDGLVTPVSSCIELERQSTGLSFFLFECSEGWEKLALYEYYKVKNAARKIKEEKIQSGERERSRSPSPIVIEASKPKRIKKRSYRWVIRSTESDEEGQLY